MIAAASRYEWPDTRALLDDFADYFAEIGAELVIVSQADLDAGLERARLAEQYDPDLDPYGLAALIFDGVATHALLDGNKRLAWQAMTTFLLLNGVYLDAPEGGAAAFVLQIVTRARTVEDLAAYLRAHGDADSGRP